MRFARVSRGLMLAAVGATPLACVSEPAPTPAPVLALDIATACAEYVAAHETAALCTSPNLVPPGQWQVPVPPEQLRTRKLFEERCRSWLGAPGSGLTPALLHACSIRVRAQCLTSETPAFSWELRELAFCDLDIPGTLPDGAPCGDSTQCAGGLCYRNFTPCGACVSRAAVGELCLPYGCARGAVCPFCKGQNCQAGFRCVADVPERGDEGELCTGRVDICARGLHCDETTTGTCILPGPPGTTCKGDTDCRFRRCDHGVCADQSAEGGACTFDWNCRPGLVCCGTAPLCDALPRQCAQPPPAPAAPAGGACDRGGQCTRGTRCRSGTCIPQARVGEACEGAGDCADYPFVECVSGTCQLFDPGACR
jgi:hypothetical protein